MHKKKKVIAAVLGLMLAGSATANAYESRLTPFRDLGENDWAAEHVYTLAAVQAVDGYADGGFHPLVAMSREEFIKMMTAAARAETDPQLPKTVIADVTPERWSYPMITAALQRHWVDAMLDSGGGFRPAEPIRREEVAYAMGAMLMDKSPDAERKAWLDRGWRKEQGAKAFPDAGRVDEALAPYVYYAVNQGMFEGSDRGLDPDSPLSRQEAAAVIDRSLHKEAEGKPLQVTGFYAVQSYGGIGSMPPAGSGVAGLVASRLRGRRFGPARYVRRPVQVQPPEWLGGSNGGRRPELGCQRAAGLRQQNAPRGGISRGRCGKKSLRRFAGKCRKRPEIRFYRRLHRF
ncbi:S-layer homology domain-containing protein [Paenibacillus sp. P25]|nr:S-layer homology domain-containing protein [Paenibacillus sp. P25]